MTTLEHDDGLAAIERAAAEWFFRKDRGLSARESDELEAWLRQDSRHADVFAEIAATWDQSLLVEEDLATRPAVKRVAEPIPQRRARRFAWFPVAAGAAAAVALMVGYLAWWKPAHYTGRMITDVGEIRHWELPDGSTIDLNTDSIVTVTYSFAERRIDLGKGEAHFAVAKNPDRPFTVAAGHVSVRAVGTAFDVRRRVEAIDVIVTEGKVKVAAPVIAPAQAGASPVTLPAQSLFLEAGHRVSVAIVAKAETVPPAPTVETVSAPVIAQTLAWQKRRVEFVDATLGEMVAEFNRYNRHQLVIDDPRLAAMRFGGAFPANDYPSFVKVLESTFSVTATTQGDTTKLQFAP